MGEARPNLKNWLKLNLKIGCSSFGGAGRSSLYYDAVVNDKNWLSSEEFRQIMTISQLLPGANLANLAAYLGYRLKGKLGGLLGSLCLGLPGSVLIVFLSSLPLQQPFLSRLMQGVAGGSTFILTAFYLRLITGLERNPGKGHLLRGKFFARSMLALLTALCCSLGVPAASIIIPGSIICLAAEFLL